MDFDPENNELVWCKAACGNNMHKDCFDKWRKSSGGGVRCVYWYVPNLRTYLAFETEPTVSGKRLTLLSSQSCALAERRKRRALGHRIPARQRRRLRQCRGRIRHVRRARLLVLPPTLGQEDAGRGGIELEPKSPFR